MINMPKINMLCFVINLKKDTFKKKYMQKECLSVGLEPNFIEAIYGQELSKHFLNKIQNIEKAIQYPALMRPLTPGEIGCFLSHILVYKLIIKKNIQLALILEDDITFTKNFAYNFKLLLQGIANFEFDTLLLGHHGPHSRDTLPTCLGYSYRIINKQYMIKKQVECAYGTYGYLISLNGAKKLLKFENDIFCPIDHLTGNPHIINTYVMTPPLINLHPHLGYENSLIMKERENVR
ncbi:glycosyltransferase family 25 protein [Desulfonauticus submarinus]